MFCSAAYLCAHGASCTQAQAQEQPHDSHDELEAGQTCCVQLINILTLGSPAGKGCFFPNGLHGEITVPTGFNTSVAAVDDFPRVAPVAGQVRSAAQAAMLKVPRGR